VTAGPSSPQTGDRRARRGPARAVIGLAIVGCGGSPRPAAPEPAPQTFWTQLAALCGQAFDGVVTVDRGGTAPDPFAGQRLRMHVRTCADHELRVPFHVGDDRSRTWVFTRSDGALRLHHDHRHDDGSPDVVTMYGGQAIAPGTATEQRFPADDATRALFVREGLPRSVDNVWIVEVVPDVRFAYALTRPDREFRIDFDLSAPVPPPPPPWGDVDE
jgi:hypothetical protein